VATFLILIIAIPEFYGSFEPRAQPFLEHTALKILFILVAIQIHLAIGARERSAKAYEIAEQRPPNRRVERTGLLQDVVEKINEAVEIGFFDRYLPRLAERIASFIEHTLSFVEQALDAFWSKTVRKGEAALNMLRNMQTGLLTINLIFVLLFLGVFFLLLMLRWR
jgi:hypothetical protein